LHVDRRFDLVMSLEVGEHLPPDVADRFVESLVNLGPVVAFFRGRAETGRDASPQ